MNDSATIERIARERFGMIRSGEKLYRFAPAPDSAKKDSIKR
jgi:cell division protein FtsB